MDKTVKTQPTLNLMARRLGLIYNNTSVDEKIIKGNTIVDNHKKLLDIEGVENQAVQLEYNGGRLQQERMIYDKRRSLDRALLYSYQGADVSLVNTDSDMVVRALINPNKVKQDYDEKIISIGYEYGFKPGDTFQWMGTGTYWLIYLQELTELAYFRGNCRKCSYKISYPGVDNEGNIIAKEMYAAIIGPKEDSIKTAKYNGIQQDIHNNTITLLVPKNAATMAFFDRRIANNGETYDKFCIKSLIEDDIRWTSYQVEDANWISTPGAIEVSAIEVPYNEKDFNDFGLFTPDTSDRIEQKVEDYNNQEVESMILGDTFIKPTLTYEFKYSGKKVDGQFIVGGKKNPVHIIEQDANHIKIKWTHTYSGQFDLIYRMPYTDPKTGIRTTKDITKVVVVESLF